MQLNDMLITVYSRLMHSSSQGRFKTKTEYPKWSKCSYNSIYRNFSGLSEIIHLFLVLSTMTYYLFMSDNCRSNFPRLFLHNQLILMAKTHLALFMWRLRSISDGRTMKVDSETSRKLWFDALLKTTFFKTIHVTRRLQFTSKNI